MTSLNVSIFSESMIAEPLPFSVECIATCGNVLLVGTSDGKIVLYELVRATGSGSWEAQLAHMHALKAPQPILNLIVIPDQSIVIAATVDGLSVHAFSLARFRRHRESSVGSTGGARGLLDVTHTISGLKEVVACVARRLKGSVLVAVLLRRRVLIYECIGSAMESGGSVVLRQESVALPDGVRCVAWTTKGVLIGFRKSYAMLHVPSGIAGKGVDVATSHANKQNHNSTSPLPIEMLYGPGSSGTSFLATMSPVPEVLVAVNSAFHRALPDGALIAEPNAIHEGDESGHSGGGGGGDGLAVPWLGGSSRPPLPALTTYVHPYLLVAQPQPQRGQRVSLEVYFPLAATLSRGTGTTSSDPTLATHVQTLRVNARRLSCRGLADLDTPMPSKTSPPDALTHDMVLAVDDVSHVHVLERTPAEDQTKAFAAVGYYETGELLCHLCPHEVRETTRALATTLRAAATFAAGHYAAGLQMLRETGAHPMLAVQLYGGELICPTILAAYTPPPELAPLVVACARHMDADDKREHSGSQQAAGKDSRGVRGAAQGCGRQCALSVLMNDLLARRLQLSGRGASQLQPCLDTALLRVMALLGKDDALHDLLSGNHGCAIAESVVFLVSHSRWVALALLWRAAGEHAKALSMLSELARTGVYQLENSSHRGSNSPALAAPLPKAVTAALGRLVATHYAVPETLTAQSVLEAQLRGATDADKTNNAEGDIMEVAKTNAAGSEPLRQPHLTQAAAVLTLLSYLRGLSLAKEGDIALIEAHAPWLLSSVHQTPLSLSILFSPANRKHYRIALGIIQRAFDKAEEAAASATAVHDRVLRLAVVADFQAMILNDPQLTAAAVTVASDAEEEMYVASASTGGSSTSSLFDVHAGYWQNLALLVFSGAAGDPTPVAQRRLQLDTFLSTSPYMDDTTAEEFFEDEELRSVSIAERAIVYRRLGRHEKAVDMFLLERRSLLEARQYCMETRAAAGAAAGEMAYLVLLRRLFQQDRTSATTPTAAATDSTPSGAQAALELLRTCEGVSAESVLPMLPDDLPVAQVKDFLLSSLRHTTATGHAAAFEASALSAYESQLDRLLAAEKGKGILIADGGAGHVCAVCHKALRPDTGFLCFPNGVVTHLGCVEERHVCPTTGTDFRNGIMPALLRRPQHPV